MSIHCRTILIFLAALSFGCGGQVVRDADVYKTEVLFNQALAVNQASILKSFVEINCTCKEVDAGLVFDTDDCKKAAKVIVLVESRIDWHTLMMLGLAGLGDMPTGKRPDIPNPNTLCR